VHVLSTTSSALRYGTRHADTAPFYTDITAAMTEQGFRLNVG
jgi:hypothetical protein